MSGDPRHQVPSAHINKNIKDIKLLISTTPTLDGAEIEENLGLVISEVILSPNAVKDMYTLVRDVVGGRTKGYEKDLVTAREIVLKELQEQAEQLGANAIIGLQMNYQTTGGSGTLFLIAARGTAVKLAR